MIFYGGGRGVNEVAPTLWSYEELIATTQANALTELNSNAELYYNTLNNSGNIYYSTIGGSYGLGISNTGARSYAGAEYISMVPGPGVIGRSNGQWIAY